MNVRMRNGRPMERTFIRESLPPWGEYVRKDTLDAHMQRIETLMKLNMTEMRAMNDQLRAEMRAMNDQLRGEMKVMNERLENKIDTVRSDLRAEIKVLDGKIYALDGRLSQILVVVGIITTVFGLIITAIQFWK